MSEIMRETIISPTLIFNALQGSWTLDRLVSGFGRMAGRAIFAPTDDKTLRYHEDVRVLPEGGAGHDAFRDYVYRLEADEIMVSFADGMPFHRLVFERPEWPLKATATHSCKPDFYAALYRFETPDRFSVRWAVTGPRKDYITDTQFTRIPGRD